MKQKLNHTIQRRDFLHVGALSLLGLGLPNLLAGESSAKPFENNNRAKTKQAKNIILVWLNGGPSTIDMWDLKPEAKEGIRGEFKPIKTSADGINICEHLPQMARQMKHCALVRSVRHTIAEHTQGRELVITGNPISPAIKYPSIGSVVSSRTSRLEDAASDVPAYMDLTNFGAGKAGYLGSSHNPFVVDRFNELGREKPRDEFSLPEGITVEDLNRKRELLTKLEKSFSRFDKTARAEEMSRFQQQAIGILSAGKTREALDVFTEDKKTVRRYGGGPVGLHALAARRLVQAGVRFVTIGMDGWDTHSNNFGQLRNTLLPQLDTALSSLIDDLNSNGLLDETIVYCVGEFNRTPAINSQGGRDHWARSMCALVAGGGFKRGFVYGSTDKDGIEPATNPCSPADLNATILDQLGIAPDTDLMTRSGRPMKVFRDAQVIGELTNEI